MTPWLSENTHLHVGGDDWHVDLGPDIVGWTVTGGGDTQSRRTLAGLKHFRVNLSLAVAVTDLYEGTAARLLRTKDSGILVVTAEDKAMIAAPVVIPTDTLTPNPEGVLAAGVDFTVGDNEDWDPIDGLNGSYDRVTPFHLTASAATVTGVDFAKGDMILLVVTAVADGGGTVQFSVGANHTAAVTADEPQVVNMAENASWAAGNLTGVLTATGLTGNKTITGVLITGPERGIA